MSIDLIGAVFQLETDESHVDPKRDNSRHPRRWPGQVETPYILTLPVDAPFVEQDYQERMWSTLQAQQTDLAVAFDGVRLQTVHALIPIRLYSDLQIFMAGSTRRVDSWYSRYAIGLVDFSKQARMFCNLNTPEDLRAYSGDKKRESCGRSTS